MPSRKYICFCPSVVCWLLVTLIAIGTPARADDESKSKKSSSGESHRSALEFVRKHQEELAKLLEYIQKKRPEDFETAIGEVIRAQAKLENLKKRDEALYDIELSLWKNDAKLRLLAAELSSREGELTDGDRERIRKLLEEQNDLIVARLKHEKLLAESRLSQVSDQLQKRETNRESMLNKSIKQWENRVQRDDRKPKTKSTPSNKSK